MDDKLKLAILYLISQYMPTIIVNNTRVYTHQYMEAGEYAFSVLKIEEENFVPVFKIDEMISEIEKRTG